jgi:hypothetical protein
MPLVQDIHSVRSVTHDPGITRRSLLRRASAATAAAYLIEPSWIAGAPADAAMPDDWDQPDYWAFADRMQTLLDDDWSPSARTYGGPGGGTSYNATMLYVHSAAARAGHDGPARNDYRARTLAARLCESPPWRSEPASGAGGCPSAQPEAVAAKDQTHACGWGAWMNSQTAQHVVIDSAVVRGLAEAYRARQELELSAATVQLIVDRVHKAADSAFYAYPALRLNQINWPVEIYAQAVSVLGVPHLLRDDCHLQLARFADAIAHPAPGMLIPNTGPGYRFHYLPQYPASAAKNLDSAEYATIVCQALLYYDQARLAGMAELRPGQLKRLRAWVARVLCGYWTHGGYLNWDTGLGFERWHQIKKPPLCQGSLLAIALSPTFQPSRAYGRWAKHMFDRGLALVDRIVYERGGLPPAVMFGVTATPSGGSDPKLAVARYACNAAQAVMLGLTKVRAEEPPPLYAYDPDVGRLAITTPAYNTAIVPVNQGAFPYGGVELARLFDGEQRVAATIGGRPPASFGVTVHERRTGRITASQRGRMHGDLRHPPLRLVRAPRGAVGHPEAYPMLPYAGPFTELEAVATTRGPTAEIRTRHHFRARHVQTTWRLIPRGGGAHDVRVLFPSTGAKATVTAHLQDGTATELGPRTVRLADVAYFHVAGRDSGYVVVPRGPRLPGRARLIHPAPQSSAPQPGPTLALEPIRGDRLRALTVSASIAPVRNPAEAARVAARLEAGHDA